MRRTLLALSVAFTSAGALVAAACSTSDDGGGSSSTSSSGSTGNASGSSSTSSSSTSSSSSSSGGTDGGTDAPVVTDSGNDAKADAAPPVCTNGEVQPKTGQTCAGFGSFTPCTTCTPSAFGYLCFDGGPPNIDGCTRVSKTAFGDTYCCSSNQCVAVPDQDSRCTGKPGGPHRYTCPPDGTDGGFVKPPAGCVFDTNMGYPTYCCP